MMKAIRLNLTTTIGAVPDSTRRACSMRQGRKMTAPAASITKKENLALRRRRRLRKLSSVSSYRRVKFEE